MKKIFLVMLVFIGIKLKAQIHKDPPIPVELGVGNNRFGLQFLMDKRFTPASRFDFLTITSFVSSYNNDLNDLDFISNSRIGYEIYKGLALSVGLSVNVKTGLDPVAGLAYTFANKQILFVLSPSVSLSSDYNFEGLSVMECKPAITKNISLYTRFQAYYNHNTRENFHERSYM